jgi:hypothetical protein
MCSIFIVCIYIGKLSEYQHLQTRMVLASSLQHKVLLPWKLAPTHTAPDVYRLWLITSSRVPQKAVTCQNMPPSRLQILPAICFFRAHWLHTYASKHQADDWVPVDVTASNFLRVMVCSNKIMEICSLRRRWLILPWHSDDALSHSRLWAITSRGHHHLRPWANVHTRRTRRTRHSLVHRILHSLRSLRSLFHRSHSLHPESMDR